ncbi:MAG: tRNA 2-thiouridine(34) synthase MnmA [Proteobacteria bacterium]|nr:tRNA 2-thiouridine(34) synthase MnmA [Pseudomonadota bacterium]
MNTRVAVAISGGIDSLFSAHLLIRDGYDVTGIHFITGYGALPQRDASLHDKPLSRVTDHGHADQKTRSAMDFISNQLDIPIHIVDLSPFFESGVVQYFVNEYQKNKTPNPCLRCNPLIKFGVLLDFAKSIGISRIATGHYARIIRDDTSGIHLYKGNDKGKDQAYFLAFLSRKQLESAIFPLGELAKNDIQQKSADLGLTPVSSKESQDICFIHGDYKHFLKGRPGFKIEPGPITTMDGKIIGRHQGLHSFTIGQRRGINCPAAFPYYVIGLEVRTNTLIVGPKEALLTDGCTVTGLSWINPPITFPATVTTRIRYAHAGTPSTLSHKENGNLCVEFHEPVSSVTPGQGAVFYDGDEILGGGWIV